MARMRTASAASALMLFGALLGANASPGVASPAPRAAALSGGVTPFCGGGSGLLASYQGVAKGLAAHTRYRIYFTLMNTRGETQRDTYSGSDTYITTTSTGSFTTAKYGVLSDYWEGAAMTVVGHFTTGYGRCNQAIAAGH
jgi:hypothetical protein